MTQFHAGQDVEIAPLSERFGAWRKAKIVRGPALCAGEFYEVQLPDGLRAVIDAEYIRAASPDLQKGIAGHPQETSRRGSFGLTGEQGMTNFFHEGQEVEVEAPYRFVGTQSVAGDWHKAEIISASAGLRDAWVIQFQDGTRAVADASRLRSVQPDADRPDDGAEPNADEDERGQLYMRIAAKNHKINALRASHDRLLAAAKQAIPILNDYCGDAEDYEALHDAFNALQAAIQSAEE